jgi:hypothetical protein
MGRRACQQRRATKSERPCGELFFYFDHFFISLENSKKQSNGSIDDSRRTDAFDPATKMLRMRRRHRRLAPTSQKKPR